MSDTWHWCAHYRDGTSFHEHDATGRSRGFAQIDLAHCVALELVPQRAGLAAPIVRISDEMRPIFFRRRSYDLDLDTEQRVPGSERTITVLGWQRTVAGRNVKSLLACYDDGSVLLTDDDEAF